MKPLRRAAKQLRAALWDGNPRTWIGLPPNRDCVYIGEVWLAEDKEFLADVERAILRACERKAAE